MAVDTVPASACHSDYLEGEIEMAFPILADSTRSVTAGVDTHKDTHVAVVIDQLGRTLDCQSFPATRDGYRALMAWMCGHGPVATVGIEGTGSWGAGLTRYLTAQNVTVVEVARPDRRKRRLEGKSDPIDAEAAALAALAGRHTGTPKSGDGPVEAIRALTNVRRSAIRDRTATINQIRSMIDTSDNRQTLKPLTSKALTTKLQAARPAGPLTDPNVATNHALKTLSVRWRHLNDQISDLDRQLDPLVTSSAPNLTAAFGVGTRTAATLLICAGDNPERLSSSAAFAALCGVSPIQASSGKTVRHRLNRGGNRQANSALHTITLTRLAHDERTQTYAERRTEEGLTKREIIRCIKRALARELYPHIKTDLNHTN